MASCSFVSDNDSCGAVHWAADDTAIRPLLSCNLDMTGWLKNKFKGSGASGMRGRPGKSNSSTGKTEIILLSF